ncbi:hypothetical protein [Rhizobium sp. BK176]|uniref:hypothetical protein n=1 Tax=Rhizobium sp. BK176 TaxID=2587071 RepID=UPI00216A9423|nr:hypothetical protein [Rhizobium sp. BK176]MCS4089215.1 hypothetical protein [Rhizobium sp. BK176]
MRITSILYLAAGFLSAPTIGFAAAECNFDRPVGSCKGTIQVLSSGGSTPSFTAEIKVQSSAKSCSKVEYSLDSTPQTTILRGGNSTQESLSGTTPISKTSIQVQKCTAYEDAATPKKTVDGLDAELNGTWLRKLNLSTIKGTVRIDLSDSGGAISGSANYAVNEQYLPGKWKKKTESKSLNGTREGVNVTLTLGDSPYPVRLVLKGRKLIGEDGQVWATRQ